jgi:hypothetical protein
VPLYPGRVEVNTINVLRLEASSVRIERHSWDETAQAFQPSWAGAFQRTPEGWR